MAPHWPVPAALQEVADVVIPLQHQVEGVTDDLLLDLFCLPGGDGAIHPWMHVPPMGPTSPAVPCCPRSAVSPQLRMTGQSRCHPWVTRGILKDATRAQAGLPHAAATAPAPGTPPAPSSPTTPSALHWSRSRFRSRTGLRHPLPQPHRRPRPGPGPSRAPGAGRSGRAAASRGC